MTGRHLRLQFAISDVLSVGLFAVLYGGISETTGADAHRPADYALDTSEYISRQTGHSLVMEPGSVAQAWVASIDDGDGRRNSFH